MSQVQMADLRPKEYSYQTSRPLWAVIVGEVSAAVLINAFPDKARLQSLLEQPQWTKVALDEPHCFYAEDRPSQGEGDVRTVKAMPYFISSAWSRLQPPTATLARSLCS